MGRLIGKVCRELKIENSSEVIPNLKLLKSQKKRLSKEHKLYENLKVLKQECLDESKSHETSTKDIWRWVRDLLESVAS